MNLGIVDMHYDLLLDLYDKRAQSKVIERDHLPEWQAGGIGVLGVAIYLEDKYLPELALRTGLGQVARLHAEIAGDERFALCRTQADILAARSAGKIAFLLTMEGVEPLNADLDMLRVFYALGLRSLGITHVRRNAAGDGGVFAPSGSSPAGLSGFGKRLVQEAEALGILIDLAHLNPAGVEDVLRLTNKPLILSHTNPRRFHDIERNSTDGQIKAVAERGGVIGINAVLLTQDPQKATVDHYIDHLLYVAELTGIEHVAIGFDFVDFLYRRWTQAEIDELHRNLAPPAFVPDLRNHSHAQNLVRRLGERGFGPKEQAAVLGGNWMRVLGEVIG